MSPSFVQKFLKISKQVIRDCALDNGAIVAANTDKDYYPRRGANYRWVWPRDAAFVCLAADILKMPKIWQKYFQWLLEKPQDFKKDGLLYANYATNGRFGSMGRSFEVDQIGTTLWVINEIFYQKKRKLSSDIKELVKRLADGLTNHWDKTHFDLHTVDIWEESQRQTTITMENNFTYSLAASACGLLSANEMMPNRTWKETAREMIEEINESYCEKEGYFYRNVGKISDKNIDASILGLLWPFKIYEPKDKRILSTINKIEKNLVVDRGVHRYQFDYYDSEGAASEGGGAWVVLNFWLAIDLFLIGQKEKSLDYYNWPLKQVSKYNGYFPEQIFSDFRIGVYPLAWSHALFVIASKILGKI